MKRRGKLNFRFKKTNETIIKSHSVIKYKNTIGTLKRISKTRSKTNENNKPQTKSTQKYKCLH